VQGRGEGGEALALVLVPDANLDLRQPSQHVELGDVDARKVVDGMRVLELNQIEPAATTRTSSGDSKLASNLAKSLASRIEQLCGEGALSNTSRVRLN
jgi:hypothetical protein